MVSCKILICLLIVVAVLRVSANPMADDNNLAREKRGTNIRTEKCDHVCSKDDKGGNAINPCCVQEGKGSGRCRFLQAFCDD